REGYERAPEAGRGLALILVALAVGGEWHRAGFSTIGEMSGGALAVLVAHGMVAAGIAWAALGRYEGTDGGPDRLLAVVVGLAAAFSGPALLAPYRAHWYYQGQLQAAVEACKGRGTDLDY